MLTVERMREGGLSGDRRWVRCADGINGEYIVMWRRVLSLMRSRLLDSGERLATQKTRRRVSTEETKVASVDNCMGVCFACEIIESGKTATNVGDA